MKKIILFISACLMCVALTANAEVYDNVELSWQVDEYQGTIDGYKIYQEDGTFVMATEALSAIFPAPEECMTWFVVSYKGVGESKKSETITFCQKYDLPVPNNLNVRGINATPK